MTDETKQPDLAEMKEAVTQALTENRRLTENLQNITNMFRIEDAGWLKLNAFWGEDAEGLSLDDLKDWSEQIREAIAGNSQIKRGSRLRSTYVWSGGIHYDNIPSETRGRRTADSARNVNELVYEDPACQRNFFGQQARTEREVSLYSDSIYFALGDNATRKMTAVIPLFEITGEYRNPDNQAEIWAYRRTWNSYAPGTVDKQQKNVWYFTDQFSDKSQSTIKVSNEDQTVDQTKTLFDLKVNTQVGWAYGVPDALAALIWARLYRDFLTNGKIVSDALAQFAFTMTANTPTGADTAGATINTGGTGKTAILGVSQMLQPLTSAGKVYEFDGGRPLSAQVATALEVSNIHLNSDPGNAGSSYGSAQTLDLPTRLAIQDRRQLHIEFDLRVLRWMGAKKVVAWFDPLVDATDYFRSMQGIMLKWNSGLYGPEQIKRDIEGLQQKWGHIGDIPDGVMIPNNKNSLNRRDVDPNQNLSDPDPVTQVSQPGTGESTGSEGLEADDIALK